jgi:hypothetical protein
MWLKFAVRDGAPTIHESGEIRRRVAGEVVIGAVGWGGDAKLHTRPRTIPMTEERMASAELVQKAGEGDFLRPWPRRCCRS